MCHDDYRLYIEADLLVLCLLALTWWHPDRYDPARLARAITRAKERRERRGEALAACQDAEAESLAWAEAQADYARGVNDVRC